MDSVTKRLSEQRASGEAAVHCTLNPSLSPLLLSPHPNCLFLFPKHHLFCMGQGGVRGMPLQSQACKESKPGRIHRKGMNIRPYSYIGSHSSFGHCVIYNQLIRVHHGLFVNYKTEANKNLPQPQDPGRLPVTLVSEQHSSQLRDRFT